MSLFGNPSRRRSALIGNDFGEYREQLRPIEAVTSRSDRSPKAGTALLAVISAGSLAVLCLGQGFYGPFGRAAGLGNFCFWVMSGMLVGLVFRISSQFLGRYADGNSAGETA
jgi:hypothetical protein